MAFNPEQHLTDIKGRKYLDVKWRIVWFRENHPRGRIETELFTVGDMIVARAVVIDADGQILASGSATVREAKQNEATWSGRVVEKAETAAIGRALAHAGFGTQFTGEDDGDNLADSPVDKKQSTNNAKTQQRKSVEEPSPKVDPQDAWNKDNIQAFFNYWTVDRKYTKEAILAALKVNSGKEWKGTLTEAQAAMESYAEMNPPF